MRLLVLALLCCAACTPERAAAPDAAVSAPPPDMVLLGHRALRDEGGTLVPVFDAESMPVVRVEGAATRLALDPVAPFDAEVRGKWTFLRARGAAPPPGAGTLRVLAGGRVLKTWPVRWAAAPETLPALAPIAGLRRAKKSREALQALDTALPAMDAEARHWALAERARLLWALDAGERATEAWAAAADAARAASVPSEESRRLRAAAYTALMRRQLATARQLLARAEPVEAGLDDPRGRARQDYYAGLLAQKLGDYREASLRLERAVRLATETGADADRVMFTEILADLYQELGRHLDALRLIGELQREGAAGVEDPATHARFLFNRCWIEMRAMAEGAMPADWPGVRGRLESVLERARAAKDRLTEAETIVNLAEAARLAGDVEEARRWLASFESLNDRADRSSRLFALALGAELLLAGGETKHARDRFETVLALDSDASDATWRAWYGIGRALRADGQAARALDAFRRALAELDRLGRRTGVHRARASFFADRRGLVQDTVALLLERGDVAGAFATVDASLSRTVRTVERPLLASGLDDARAARWSALSTAYLARRDAWEALEREAGLSAGSAREAVEARVEAARSEAARSLDEALVFLESTAPAPSAAVDVGALGRALGPDEALVEFGRIGERHVGFWVQGGRVEHAFVAPDAPLAPWASRTDGLAHLYVVDGLLPEAATLGAAPGVGGVPLAARLSVSHLPHAALLLRPGTAAPGAPLVVADPGFDLPHARLEGRDVTERLTGARLLSGADATRARVLEQATGARVFHFAGHGVLDPGQPWDAHLRLAGDERLTLADVLVARLPLGVVVLSGCETGRAAALSRVESLGLPAAFLVAGARAVVATDREVPDDQARRFVARFYAAGGTERPGPAFRQAVAETHAAGEPVWSAFHLFGRP